MSESFNDTLTIIISAFVKLKIAIIKQNWEIGHAKKDKSAKKKLIKMDKNL